MQVFSETETLESDEDTEEVTRGKKYITVANATSTFLEVELDKVTLVRAANKREVNCGIGASPLAGEANLQFGRGAATMETLELSGEIHDIGPHSLSKVPVPSSSMEARGQAINVKNSLQVFIYQAGPEKKKIGSYIVGPGHGLIVSSINQQYQAEQAKGRSWKRKFDPWLNRLDTTRDPHALLARGEKCILCGFKKKK